ncbi:MAG TPA: hypothetical protein VHO69_05380 [Phototrophicaceae bacterium]|nr:hypothetical protein [Phototrophicaceae bacterium]
MAKRRRNSSSRSNSTRSTTAYRGKSEAEARAERLTWFFLVLIFAILQIFTQNGIIIQYWLIPLSGSIVLLGSGLYQYTRRWRVSPFTWLAGALLLFLCILNIYFSPGRSCLGESLVIFAIIILLGLLTGET